MFNSKNDMYSKSVSFAVVSKVPKDMFNSRSICAQSLISSHGDGNLGEKLAQGVSQTLWGFLVIFNLQGVFLCKPQLTGNFSTIFGLLEDFYAISNLS